jgi:hypothetical protein
MVLSNSNKIHLNTRNLDKTIKIIIICLIFLSVFQQMPIIRDNFYSEIRIILYILFGIFSFVSLLKS